MEVDFGFWANRVEGCEMEVREVGEVLLKCEERVGVAEKYVFG